MKNYKKNVYVQKTAMKLGPLEEPITKHKNLILNIIEIKIIIYIQKHVFICSCWQWAKSSFFIYEFDSAVMNSNKAFQHVEFLYQV